ncbi:MAG: hypothetical protein A3F83_00835, partial [Candidatus Glassbacteria bacterium RIFCSPLOWO2_12_FULL_58_11]
MFLVVLKKELLENLLSFKFLLITAVTTLLVSTSTFVMYRAYQLQLENYDALKPSKDQPVAIIPPSPLSIFVRGLEENLGRSHTIAFGGQVEVGSGQQTVNTLFRLFTTPDLLYITKVIMALAALLFAFGAVNGEKENCTLRLILAGSVRRSTLLAGKWAGSFLSLSLPFVILAGLSAAVVSLLPDVQLDGADWLRLGLLLLGALAYLAAFFSLGFLISSLTARSSSALVFSLLLWTVFVFVAPSLGNILARQLVDVSSVQNMSLRRNQVWTREIFELIEELKKVPLSEQTQENLQKMRQRALENINIENDRLNAEYRGRLNLLAGTARLATMLSPSSCFSFYAMDIAGTGLPEERRLKEAVLRYKDQVWDRPTSSSGRLGGEFEAFVYDRTPVAEVLRASGL